MKRSSPAGFKIDIVGLAGPLAELDVEPSWTVNDVQRAVSRKFGIRKREQRLFMGGVCLSGEQNLQEYGVVAGAQITLLKRDPEEAKTLEEISAVNVHDIRSIEKLLEGASPDVRGNREVIMSAVRKHVEAIGSASEELRSDREFMLSVLQEAATSFCYACWTLKDSPAFFEIKIYKVIPEYFRGDRQIMLAAVKRGYAAFQYADSVLLSDRDFVIAVMNSKPAGLLSAKGSLQHFLGAVGGALCSDLEVVEAIVRATGLEAFEMHLVSDTLRNDAAAMYTLVRLQGLAVQYASEAIRANHKIAIAAARQNRWALHHVSKDAAAAANLALKPCAREDHESSPIY